MKKVLFFSVALVATGLQGSGNEPKLSPIKVLVRNGVSVQPVPLTPESCRNSSFRGDMRTPSKCGNSPFELTPSCRITTPFEDFVEELNNIRSSKERSKEEYAALVKEWDIEHQKTLINSEEKTRKNIFNGQLAAVARIWQKMETQAMKIADFKLQKEQEEKAELHEARLRMVLEWQRLYNCKTDKTALCPLTGEMFDTRTGETISE
jgi:hypothetical protein